MASRDGTTSRDGDQGTTRHQQPRCQRCGGNIVSRRFGEYVTVSCMSCGHTIQDDYLPQTLGYRVNVPPPKPQEPTVVRRRSSNKPTLEIEEPELSKVLDKYCDLRRRGFTQEMIRTKSGWPKQYPNLLLEEATKRKMPGSQESQANAIQEWLLAMFDAGAELSVIQRLSALTDQQTKSKLQAALDNASGPAPTGLIIRSPDGQPARVSWLDVNGTLMHRPFDGAFPADYPAKLAIRQCTEVTQRLVGQQSKVARDRAYHMLLMAEDGLHSFDYDVGRQVYTKMEAALMDEDAKRTVILKLHSDPNVAQLLLQRCGMRARWLTGNGARTLSRRLRKEEFSPALTRNLVEYLGNDPNTYYIIGADYRIPEPSEEAKVNTTEALLKAGFATEIIENAFATLGVPPGGRHPPKRKTKQEPVKRRSSKETSKLHPSGQP